MRSSPRATTKASTAAASSSPAKSRGRRGEKAEDDPAHVAEAEEPVTKKGRGRPTSTGRGDRGSRSRGRRGAGDEEEEEVEEKTTPPSTSRRGRGKGKADATPTEDDAADKEKEEEEKESEEAEEEEDKTPKSGRGRSRGRGRGKSPAAATPKSSARGSRSSRRSGVAEEANEEEEAVPEKEVKTTPTRGRGRGRGGSRSRGRPGRGKAAAEEEGGDVDMDTSVTADAEEEKEPAEEKPEPDASKEDAADKESEEKEDPEAAKEPEEPEPKPEPEKASPAKSAAKPTAAEPMEQETTEAETKDVNNGDISDKQEPKKQAGVKRKLEEDETEAVAEVEQDSKRAKVNGEEPKTTPVKASEVPATVTPQKEATAAVDTEISQDFVMVNKEDVPPADSMEVAVALPKPAPILPPVSADVVSMEDAAPIVASASPVVVPLTEAEVAKAYAKQIQGKQSEDRDEVSSVVVEVGSVAGSDVSGLSVSRGLDTSEVQSGSNSIDGDFPDTSITVTQASSTSAAPDDPAPAACQQQSVNVINPVPVPQASPLNPQSTPLTPQALPQNSSTSNNGLSDSRGVNPQALAPSVSSAGTPVDNVIPVQNSGCPPSAKSSSSVSDRLGTPDSTFLASYKAPTIFSRAYVPNVAAPPELLDPARTFSVVSYNILAECARLRSDYSYTAPEFLGQEYRHALMMREIQYLNGDIVCMQEVNPAYFNNTLLPDMRKLGYDGLVMKRTKDYFDEGEATFYKVAAFDLECSKGISLAEVARKEVELGGLRPEVGAAVNRYLDRADVVLITKLRSKVTGKSFTIGNIHVVWDQMTSPDVQCIQAACAIKEVVGMAGGEGSPHIICGDFNSEWNSPAYQLVLDGYLSDTSIRKLQAVEKLELAEGSKSLVNHLWRAFQHTSSNLRSSYSTVTGSEPEITTFTRHMHSSVDYIFYSSGSLVPVGILKTVDKAVVDATGGLPDREFPSDHLAMKAVMAFS